MNGNSLGMGMGMDGMLGAAGGGPSGRYVSEYNFQQPDFQQPMSAGAPVLGGYGISGGGMGGAGGAANMGAAGMHGFAGFQGVGTLGGAAGMLPQGRDDELLLSLLRERNQFQGVGGPGAMPGVVTNIYSNGSTSGSTAQGGLFGGFGTTAGNPYDLTPLPRDQGLGLPSFFMDAQMNSTVGGAGNAFFYDQQRQGIIGAGGPAPGMSLGFGGFDQPSSRDPTLFVGGPQQLLPLALEPEQILPQTQPQASISQKPQARAVVAPAADDDDFEDDEDPLPADRELNVPHVPAPAATSGPRPPLPPRDYRSEKPPFKKNLHKTTGRKASEAPRRPLSAYNLFFSDERERILKEKEAQDGDGKKSKMQVQELAKIIGERWKVLPDEWRRHYQDLADEDMKRHKEMKKRAPKDSSIPKRPPTAFLLFSNKRRKALKRQYPDATNSDLSKMLSKTWREAPEQIREKYMDEAAELAKIYKANMVVWRKKVGERRSAGGGDDDSASPLPLENRAKQVLKKAVDDDDFSDIPLAVGLDGRPPFLMGNEDDMESTGCVTKPTLPSRPPPIKKRKSKDPSAPKRPLSAFLAFSNTRRKPLKQQYPDATNADLSKMLSKMWREAPNEFRQKFIDDAAELSEAYKSEMAEWKLQKNI